MASKTVNGKKVLVGSKADPSSRNYKPKTPRSSPESGGTDRTVTLNDGKVLTGQDAQDYGNVPTAEITARPGAGLVSSSDSVVSEENKITSDVKGLAAPRFDEKETKRLYDDSFKLLDDYAKELESRGDERVKAINQQYDELKTDTQDAQKREGATTNVALTRVGGYLGTQISAVGVLNNQAKEHRAEIASLEAKRAATIQDALDALSDKQFAVAKLRVDEVKAMAKDINDRRQQFFQNTMAVLAENRQAEAHKFEMGTKKADRAAFSIIDETDGMDDKQKTEYIRARAKSLGVDESILAGSVDRLTYEENEKIQTAVVQMASKYPSSGITQKDDLATALTKIRGSKEYSLDIRKAELDIANTLDTMRSRRAADARAASEVDTSWNTDARIIAYQNATGTLVTSKSEARAVIGYADSLLSDKEVVSDDTPLPALTEGRIRESDAKKLLTDSYTKFGSQKDTGVSEADAWAWLASDEAQAMNDESKKTELMRNGLNPEDFSIY